jgi:hypothetical protein
MIEQRSLGQILTDHPGPWKQRVLPGVHRNGGAEVQVLDAKGGVVQLFTILRVAELVSIHLKPTPPTEQKATA